MSIVKIVPPKSDGRVQVGMGTKVYAEDGTEIKEVISADIRISAGEFITAHLHVAVDLEEVWAHAIMSEENMKAAAERYGYDLTKKSDLVRLELLARRDTIKFPKQTK